MISKDIISALLSMDHFEALFRSRDEAETLEWHPSPELLDACKRQGVSVFTVLTEVKRRLGGLLDPSSDAHPSTVAWAPSLDTLHLWQTEALTEQIFSALSDLDEAPDEIPPVLPAPALPYRGLISDLSLDEGE